MADTKYPWGDKQISSFCNFWKVVFEMFPNLLTSNSFYFYFSLMRRHSIIQVYTKVKGRSLYGNILWIKYKD